MPDADRRLAHRTKLDQVAYIHIEPDNGAIVLNASGEGLGFHSMAPVDPTAPLRFSVQEQNRRVDICGELVWTDEFQKIGGVRFNTLTAEAREQILAWIRKSGPVPVERSTLGAALLKALPTNGSPRSVFSFEPALAWWKSGRRLKVSGFARGLASGFTLSLFAFAIVLFCYAHRREFGESLIRMGERLGANRDRGVAPENARPAMVSSTTAPSAIPVKLDASARTVEANSSFPTTTAQDENASSDDKRPIAVLASLPTPSHPRGTQPVPLRPKLEQAKAHETSISGTKSVGSAQSQSMPTPISAPSFAAVTSQAKEAQVPTPTMNQVAALIHNEPVAPLAVGVSPLNARSDLQMFFDVGRFKKDWMAQNLSNKIAQLGVRTSVVQRGHLWMSSYQVLAGPYNNEAAEKQLREKLLSHGYEPRPYERGSRDFSFHSRVSVHGSQLPTGDLSIGWETYVTDTKIKFMQGRYLVAAVNGKWIHRDSKFLNNEYVYQIQQDKSRPLLELHFAGMDRALVLQNLQ